MKESNSKPPEFEEIYPEHEFSELVRLSIGLAALWRGFKAGRRPDGKFAGSARPARLPRALSWPRFGKQLF